MAEKVERAKFVMSRRLKDCRVEQKLSQVRLADKANLSLRCVQKVEHGEVLPDVYTLFKLSEVLGVRPAELMREL